MKNNELLQSICSALSLTQQDIGGLLELCDHAVDGEQVAALLDECSNEQLRCFLEGLILAERGPRDDGTTLLIEQTAPSNNEVLKKLRVALNLQEEDMLLIFEEGGATLSRSEFSALFRKPDNKHYRACSDELLLQFLSGFQPQLDT
jgi:uncharacterized protein YehS (DUF1456 family)